MTHKPCRRRTISKVVQTTYSYHCSRKEPSMKRYLSLLVALAMTLSATSFIFANPETAETDPYCVSVTAVNSVSELSKNWLLRGTNPPTQVGYLSSGMSYHGEATYSVAVYTNKKFADHGGSIKISVDNSQTGALDPDSAYMTVKICHSNFWGNQVVDGSCVFGAEDSGNHTFSGLNTGTQYYFQFVNGSQTYTTTTEFTITRGN